MSNTHIPFLDTYVYIHNNKLITRLYKKPTDNKQYVHFDSQHPTHVKKSIPYAQAIRYKRIIVDPVIFIQELNNLKQNFRNRFYSVNITQKSFNRVEKLNWLDLLQYTNKNPNTFQATPFVVTFCNSLISHKTHNIYNILEHSWKLLIMHNPILQFMKIPKLVFKKRQNIGRALTSTKLPPQLGLTIAHDLNINTLYLSHQIPSPYHIIIPM